MRPRERESLERLLRELCERGELGRVVELALAAYEPELLRLLGSILRDPERTREAFSDVSEHLLRSLPSFRWESSLRTWVYRLARNIGYRHATAPARRELPVSRGAFLHEVQPERSQTNPWLQTLVKERFRLLREQLTRHEQTLLLLRVDQQLSWLEVARALSAPDEDLTAEALSRKAAVLRQQFQRIKVRLRELAQEEELLSAPSA